LQTTQQPNGPSGIHSCASLLLHSRLNAQEYGPLLFYLLAPSAPTAPIDIANNPQQPKTTQNNNNNNNNK
jgi:hypothetical protein